MGLPSAFVIETIRKRHNRGRRAKKNQCLYFQLGINAGAGTTSVYKMAGEDVDVICIRD